MTTAMARFSALAVEDEPDVANLVHVARLRPVGPQCLPFCNATVTQT
jgi:hypothetical protein